MIADTSERASGRREMGEIAVRKVPLIFTVKDRLSYFGGFKTGPAPGMFSGFLSHQAVWGEQALTHPGNHNP